MARTHGLIGTYVRGGCRCEECKCAAKEYRRRYPRHTVRPRVPVDMCPHCSEWFEVLGRHEWRCPERTA